MTVLMIYLGLQEVTFPYLGNVILEFLPKQAEGDRLDYLRDHCFIFNLANLGDQVLTDLFPSSEQKEEQPLAKHLQTD